MSERSAIDREAVRDLLRRRDAQAEEEFVFGAERVTIERVGEGNGPFRVRKRDFEFLVDEPPERGGTDSAPNPLAYFLAGAATCLLSHYMLCAIADDLRIDGLSLTARGRFNRRLTGGAFTEVVYDVKIESREERDAILRLAERAEEMCYAHNTLANAGVGLTQAVHLNGERVAVLEKGGDRRSP